MGFWTVSSLGLLQDMIMNSLLNTFWCMCMHFCWVYSLLWTCWVIKCAYLQFWDNTRLFSNAVAPVYAPPQQCMSAFTASHACQHLALSIFFISAILYLTVILIFTSLIYNEVAHFFIWLLAICLSSFVKYLLPVFLLGCPFFFLLSFFYIFWIKVLR